MFLRFFAPRSVHKWRQWSDSMYQFNLLHYCLRCDWTSYIKFLNFWGIYNYIDWNWSLNRMGPVSLPENLKEGVLEELKKQADIELHDVLAHHPSEDAVGHHSKHRV
ncbi:hypothetical protein NL676_036367 [Syzygium grande]|nr:hypothetical protein NL676_036367 [Syzygium grande]